MKCVLSASHLQHLPGLCGLQSIPSGIIVDEETRRPAFGRRKPVIT
jgi:hypothetical protein